MCQRNSRSAASWEFWMTMIAARTTRTQMMIVRGFILPPVSEPLLFPKIDDERNADGDHHPPEDEIPVPPFELGHELEVHPVDSGDERERDEDRPDDGQEFHNLVHPVADARKV